MNDSRRATRFLTLGAAGLLLAACGCRWSYKVPVTETGAPGYDRLEIVYTVQEGGGALASPAAERSTETGLPVRQAGHTPGFSGATLRIEFPHPDGSEQLVRATLRLTHDSELLTPEPPSWTDRFRSGFRWMTSGQDEAENDDASGSEDEVWVLDFPKEQLDLVLIDLADTGFFDDQQRRDGSAYLSIAIDRGRTAKSWTPEPRLDDLVERVYREGWLLGFMPREESGRTPVRTVGWTRHDEAVIRHLQAAEHRAPLRR